MSYEVTKWNQLYRIKVDELRSHKVEPVISHKGDLLLLSSLQEDVNVIVNTYLSLDKVIDYK